MDLAMSSGLPLRPTGVSAANCSNKLFLTSAGKEFHQAVSITPGEMALIRKGRNSLAQTGIINSIAPLIAASPEKPGFPEVADTAVIKVALPVLLK